MPYIGSDTLAALVQSSTLKPFNFHTLIMSVAAGIEKWAATYNTNRDKFEKFVERYDSLISDTRLAGFVLDNPPINTPL